MNPIRVESQLKMGEVQRITLRELWRKPIFIAFRVVGGLAVLYFILEVSGVLDLTPDVPATPVGLALGIFVFAPIVLRRYMKRTYQTNQRLFEPMVFEFDEEELRITGTSFSSQMTWEKLYQVKEHSGYFLFFQSRSVMHLMSKEHLAEEDRQALLALLGRFPSIKQRLRGT